MIEDFCRLHPGATRRQWIEVAVRFAEEAYRVGFGQGWQAAKDIPEASADFSYLAGEPVEGEDEPVTDELPPEVDTVVLVDPQGRAIELE